LAASTDKKPWVAFLLSFLLPGAGLAYLGQWGWAVLNLVVAIGVPIIAIQVYPDLASPLAIGLGVGSAVMAKNMTERMNVAPGVKPPMGAPIQPAATVPPAPPTPVGVLCSACGVRTEEGNFCSECGSPLIRKV
jgi:hypothetical protein